MLNEFYERYDYYGREKPNNKRNINIFDIGGPLPTYGNQEHSLFTNYANPFKGRVIEDEKLSRGQFGIPDRITNYPDMPTIQPLNNQYNNLNSSKRENNNNGFFNNFENTNSYGIGNVAMKGAEETFKTALDGLNANTDAMTNSEYYKHAINGNIDDEGMGKIFTNKKRVNREADKLFGREKYESTGGNQGNYAESSQFDNHNYIDINDIKDMSAGEKAGSVGMGMAKGAAMGMSIGGPWGALIGGAAGGLASGLSFIGSDNRRQRMIDEANKVNRLNTGIHEGSLNNANTQSQINDLQVMANIAKFGGELETIQNKQEKQLIGLKRKKN